MSEQDLSKADVGHIARLARIEVPDDAQDRLVGELNHILHWVAQLAAQLRQDGVDARLDRWHLQRGQTIPEFMNSEVRSADKVLVLCSPKYREKVHAMEDGGPSTGSGWESMLLSSAMFTQDARSKVVVALARGQWQESAPDYLLALPYDDLTQAGETDVHGAYTHAITHNLIV